MDIKECIEFVMVVKGIEKINPRFNVTALLDTYNGR